MNQSPSQYQIGRNRTCDVVIDDSMIAAFHCQLTGEHDRWTLTPREGTIGIRNAESGEIKWWKTAVDVQPTDDLWLDSRTRFPWPCEAGASKVLTVGRAIDCDVTLDNASVSGQHARLIVGQRATFVLKDCASRNGLFVDKSLNERVSAAMLIPDKHLFFGSYKVSAKEIIELAEPRPSSQPPRPPVITERPSRAARSSTRTQPMPAGGLTWIRQASLIGVPALATILIWLAWSSRSDPIAEKLPAATPKQSSARARTLSADKTDDLETPELSSARPHTLSADITDDLATPKAAAVVEPLNDESAVAATPVSPPDDAIRKSIYWILIRHDASNAQYRLGTGIAIAANKILTTGSIVASIDQLVATGYSNPAIVSIDGGPVLPIASRQVWPEFANRTERAETLRKAHDKLAAEPSADESNEAVARSARLLNFALAAASATDIGWMRVDGLDHHLQVDSSVAFRPGQAVELCHAGFDGKDPFYDRELGQAGSSSDQQTVRLRVRGRGPSVEDISGVIQLECPSSINRDENLLGSPLVRDDTVVGIIVFQSTDHSDPMMIVEAVAGSTISEAMISTKDDPASPEE